MPFDGKVPETQDQLTITAAQERLRKDGWCRSAMLNRTGERCVMGALVGAGESLWYRQASPAIDKALLDEVRSRGFRWFVPPQCGNSPGWVAAVGWNNFVAKNAEEVIDFLECVKARL